MKKLVDTEYLNRLEYAEAVLNELKANGVDNWQGYDECEFPDKSEFLNVGHKVPHFKQGQELFYFNNECKFMGYLDDQHAMINLIYTVGTDLSGNQWCTPCNIGGHSTHACSESQEIIDEVIDDINYTTTPFIIPVKILDLRKNKFVLEEDAELREKLRVERKKVINDTAEQAVRCLKAKERLDAINAEIAIREEVLASLTVDPFEIEEEL